MLKHLLFLFTTCFILSSCSQQQAPNTKTVFRYNESGNISSLDPAFARNLENIWGINQLYSTLVEFDDSLNLKPLLCTKYTVDSTGTLYCFSLRKDVYFHDNACFKGGKGRKLVAQDVVYSLNRLRDPKIASPGKWVLNDVADDSLAIFAPSDTILCVKLKEPNPAFINFIAMDYCAVVAKEAVDFYQENFRANPVGTGPFKFFIWKESIGLVLHKNEGYFEQDSKGNSLPYLDAVHITFLKDLNTNYLKFLQGEYDFLSGLDPSYKDEIIDADGDLQEKMRTKLTLHRTPFLKTDYLGFHIPTLEDTPLSKVEIRRALDRLIDKKALVKYLRNGVGVPALNGFVPPVLKDKMPEPDTYLANVDLTKVPEIVISTTATAADVAEYVQGQWQRHGLKVKVDVLPSSVQREGVANGRFQLFRKSWIGDYPDAQNFLSLFYSPNFIPNGPNYFEYKNTFFDSIYEASLAEQDVVKRRKIYSRLDSILVAECPVIPLFHDEVIQLTSPGVQNYTVSSMNILDLRKVRITTKP